MDIEDLLIMWSRDSKIDEVDLDASSIASACLHSKYLEIYSAAKLGLKRKELRLAELKRDLWLYYNGKMSKEEMDERGWTYDPYKGLSKPLKSDMGMYYDSDPYMMKYKLEVEESQVLVDTCKEIMDNIRWRHQNIKNIITWRQFQSGV